MFHGRWIQCEMFVVLSVDHQYIQTQEKICSTMNCCRQDCCTRIKKGELKTLEKCYVAVNKFNLKEQTI